MIFKGVLKRVREVKKKKEKKEGKEKACVYVSVIWTLSKGKPIFGKHKNKNMIFARSASHVVPILPLGKGKITL